MKKSMLEEMRDNVMRPAERCGIDTAGRSTEDVVTEMSSRIINLEAERFDAHAQLAALTQTVVRLRAELVEARGGGEADS